MSRKVGESLAAFASISSLYFNITRRFFNYKLWLFGISFFTLPPIVHAVPEAPSINAPSTVSVGTTFPIYIEQPRSTYYRLYKNDERVASGNNASPYDRYFTFKRFANEVGEYKYKISDCDSTGCSFSNEIIVSVENRTAPIANEDYELVNLGETTIIDVQRNDVSIHSYYTSLSEIVAPPSFGIATIKRVGVDKVLEYANTASQCEDSDYFYDRFSYTVTDSTQNASAPAEVTLKIMCQPSPYPKAINFDFNPGQILEANKGISLITELDSSATHYELYADGIKHTMSDSTRLIFQVGNPKEYKFAARACNEKGCGPFGDLQTKTAYDTSVVEKPIANGDEFSIDYLGHAYFDVVANDYDPNGIPFKISNIIGYPQLGGAGIAEDGKRVSYSNYSSHCGNNEYLEDSFSYRITNSKYKSQQGGATRVKVKIYCDTSNFPVAEPDIVTYQRNTPLDISVLSNDLDPNNVAIIDSEIVYASQHGHVLLENNIATYKPKQGSCVSDVFEYRVKNADNIWSLPSRVILNCDQSGPIANNDAFVTTSGTEAQFPVMLNDMFPTGKTTTISEITLQPKFGSVTATADKQKISYTNTFGQCITDNYFTDSVQYKLVDEAGNESNEAIVTINVICDVKPVALDDLHEYSAGASSIIPIIDNDFDPRGQILSFDKFIQTPMHGQVTLQNNQALYEPDTSECLDDAFSYQVSNEEGITTEARVDVFCGNVPVGVDDDENIYLKGNVNIKVLVNDREPRNLKLSVSEISHPPAFGFARISSNGQEIEYFSILDVCGNSQFFVDKIFYKTKNAWGQESERTELKVKVLCTPPLDPIAVNDEFTYSPDTSIVLPVLENDGDPAALSIKVHQINNPSTHGIASIVENGIEYTQPAGQCIDDSLSYQNANSNGNLSNEVLVQIWCGEGPPVASNDEVQIIEQQTVIIDVLSNDRDPKGQPLHIAEIRQQPQEGQVSLVEGGVALLYKNETQRCENTTFFHDLFTYKAKNSDGESSGQATVKVIVVCESYGLPVANEDIAIYEINSSVEIDVLANDTDPNSSLLSVEKILIRPKHGRVTLNNNVTTYSPDVGLCREDIFAYRARNSVNISADGIVRLSCNLPPPPPQPTIDFSADSVLIDHDFTITWSVADAAVCKFNGQQEFSNSGTHNLTFDTTGEKHILWTCFNSNGDSIASKYASITVNPLPLSEGAIAFSTNSVVAGQPVVVTWQVPNASSCSYNDQLQFSNGGEHSIRITTIGEQSISWLCRNANGVVVAAETVNINIRRLPAAKGLKVN